MTAGIRVDQPAYGHHCQPGWSTVVFNNAAAINWGRICMADIMLSSSTGSMNMCSAPNRWLKSVASLMASAGTSLRREDSHHAILEQVGMRSFDARAGGIQVNRVKHRGETNVVTLGWQQLR